MLAALAATAMASPMDASTLRERGFAVLEQIRREYYLPKSKLYCESIDAAGKQSGPCFNWGAGVLLSALNAAARLDDKYKPWLREYADASRIYWNDKGRVPGYDVLPCPKPVDRYYDDNAWMVLALVETYEILGDKKYLDWAEQALEYVLSGEDKKLGGGIYWRESDKKTKNTCSNAPSAAACLAVAKYRRRDELVGRARTLLDWTKAKLQDPEDWLFWDNVDLNGKVEKTKWTYNTGLYLRAKAELAKFEPVHDMLQVKTALGAAFARWLDFETFALKDSGRFAHLLMEAVPAVEPKDDAYGPVLIKSLDYLWTKARDPQGRFGDMWDRPFDPKRKKFELIDQASVARAMLFTAAHKS